MVLYNVIISPHALSQLDDYLGYIQYTLLNPIAARSLWQDVHETAEQLSRCADSLKVCSHPKLKELNYRAISLNHHHYVMLYRIIEKTAYVDAIYHLRQDFENTFAQELY